MPKKALVGRVEHRYPEHNVLGTVARCTLRVGDGIEVEGFPGVHEVVSLEVEFHGETEVKEGDDFGLKVAATDLPVGNVPYGTKIFRVLKGKEQGD